MKIYLAGTYSRNYCVEQAMKIYLAGIQGGAKRFVISDSVLEEKRLYILESFVYIDEVTTSLIPHFKGFLLDSGAFTFMSQEKNSAKPNWEGYVTRYAEYIKANNIETFFELDIDSVVGLKAVEKLRAQLERETGKQPIPVWHKSRGKDYFLGMAKDYPYISIGGIVTKEIKRSEHKIFPWFIDKAHEAGAKIHGLGYTNMAGLRKYKFDSVDSTTWLYGNRVGEIYRFNGKDLDKIRALPGMGLKSRQSTIHNFNEWVKYQNYAEKNL